jgi:D-glycero-D-manno-heptose 1,7-bisphosphate phosphatase
VSRAAVFLDKDGTLVHDVPYNVDPDRIALTSGAAEAVRALNDEGFVVVLVSNQSGVARGRFDVAALDAVERRIRALLAEGGARLDDVRWCPHLAGGVVEAFAIACGCRKPEPGMLLAAAAELDLDLARSWIVGDILDDVDAGHRAGCRSALVDVGSETEWMTGPGRVPDVIAPDLPSAASWIVGDRRLVRRRELVA